MSNTTCEPAARVTRSLLGYGVIAGPFYVLVSVGQGLTREGFDFTRHAWSLLANGDLGWLQITNFVLTGLMTIACAVGLARAIGGWVPRLIGAYGVSLIGAGAFRADPAMGFPAGTPEDAMEISWHGMLHFMVGGIGFLCLIAACLLMGRRFARQGKRGWAAFSAVTGVAFLAAFAGITSGQAALTLPFVAAVILAWTWVSAVSVHLYRQA